MRYAIHTQKLTKNYRSGFWMKQYRALSNLDLCIEKGEIFGFVGPNGAGKTTTIKILAGLHDASSGTASIFSEPVSTPKANSHIGFLPERPYFYVHLTPRELLHFYGQLYEIPRKERDVRIEELLTRTEMLDFIDVPMKSFSKGMLQRIGLCQTLLHKPNVLILDEPMSGLDPLGRALVRDIILEENNRGCTIFFSSHVLSDVEKLCDRVAILIQGTLRSIDTVGNLLSTSTLVEFVVSLQDIPEEWSATRLPSGVFRFWVESNQRESRIDELRKRNAQILEIRPVHSSLEDLLVEEIKREKLQPNKMGVWT